ncbi:MULTISPECIES: helix-turn-helix transcriptional regulator [Rhizobium/Agrobacterium group]|uniref:LuxR family transcriptional regulator n=5 Tax=Rhizobiaceae TaxID=82115 RepID=A0A2Z2PGY5_RHIRH|nr:MULTISPECIES: LuxR C-terminal-related transcriptional regulator [Rhizobium/Agrobacterium group]AQS65478.1 LuxR family transcriptional regulator [Rhizobium rhizogenes]ASK42103.1 LuxR family transcriptional regulator [Rhizobium rhizogenes]MCZ7445655.1 LuxR C-terminal-related transcriptional regulator [Rhizobium rhizogenes]MCZ7472515.1 LuxR C-terminal-related transcriptional regulator [Rhizobium rhizogenes]MCZ7483891.1 LuxR C-terminal-related transcriptional regulator [Rhizobium rhizogenes]
MEHWMLSPIEKTCLRWVSMGKTVDEIALLQGRSVIEIESYLEQALAALEASSMQEALEKASLSEPD